MSKSLISDQFWVRMSESQKVDAVVRGQATLKQLSEGLLDGSEKLRNACREFLAETNTSFENLPVDLELGDTSEQTNNASLHASNASLHSSNASLNTSSDEQPSITKPSARAAAAQFKPRFGLPEGFEPRRQRYGRSVLLELNIYRLPNGQEFIPCHPTGTLGARHLYALLTTKQYLEGKRGSVYIGSDGRIFDYSVDNREPSGDLFATGFTIYDLERTGRYPPELRRRKRKSQPAKVKRAGAAR